MICFDAMCRRRNILSFDIQDMLYTDSPSRRVTKIRYVCHRDRKILSMFYRRYQKSYNFLYNLRSQCKSRVQSKRERHGKELQLRKDRAKASKLSLAICHAPNGLNKTRCFVMTPAKKGRTRIISARGDRRTSRYYLPSCR